MSSGVMLRPSTMPKTMRTCWKISMVSGVAFTCGLRVSLEPLAYR